MYFVTISVTIMGFDTVNFRLLADEVGGTDLMAETPNYLTTISEHTFADGQTMLAGRLVGCGGSCYKVSITPQRVIISDCSLSKWELGSNDNVREFLNAVKNGTATEFYIDEFLKELHNENKLKRFYKSVFVDVVVYRINETDKFFKVDMTNVECCQIEKLCRIIEKSYPYVMLAERPQQIEFEKIGKGEYINKVMALNLKFDCNTTIDDFPPNVQNIIKADLKNR